MYILSSYPNLSLLGIRHSSLEVSKKKKLLCMCVGSVTNEDILRALSSFP